MGKFKEEITLIETDSTAIRCAKGLVRYHAPNREQLKEIQRRLDELNARSNQEISNRAADEHSDKVLGKKD